MFLTQYLKETQAELKHTSWPTKRQTVVFTVVVVLISIAVSVLLGFFDFVFSKLLNLIIN
jgi:preprotein translocase subunit SecE